ncbi:MAG TPA: 3-deoxy-manno-octulosonate cytidylyltransferase [Gemmatimonadales bacterium]|nr:3-deoxy-manno-octulosonate cytidylyltransferase [Gemmatimonadales bacterium]
MPKVLGVIPARLGAERLPGKPLRKLGGKPLVEWVARNAMASGVLERVIVATDAPSVAEAMREAGIEVTMTSTDHASGTSRVHEVVARAEFADYGIVVNVQGDEPFLPHSAIAGAVAQVERGADIGTAAVPLAGELVTAPSVVKVVLDNFGYALYFSRSPIPYGTGNGPVRHWQHLGVYAFTPPALKRWMGLEPAVLEETERLEQLRPLSNGMSIGVACLSETALPGIDTEDDLKRAEAYLASRGEV